MKTYHGLTFKNNDDLTAMSKIKSCYGILERNYNAMLPFEKIWYRGENWTTEKMPQGIERVYWQKAWKMYSEHMRLYIIGFYDVPAESTLAKGANSHIGKLVYNEKSGFIMVSENGANFRGLKMWEFESLYIKAFCA